MADAAQVNALAHNLLSRNAPGVAWKVERMLNCQSLGQVLVYEGGKAQMVEGLALDARAKAGIAASVAELSEEREAADEALGKKAAPRMR